MTTLDKIIENFSEESFLKADGFDSAVIGYDSTYQKYIVDDERRLFQSCVFGKHYWSI